eukprot:TRINITY_DN1107_c0_g3_i1.p1 TRINITY_DN1107_c0_g3~~TRINITY_DN1107_c0_g3_i1.p1  ORF type:complete len:1090 (+),score=387.33 TRINITY_DN1107_c0_g3_i1:154-3423(+)
MYVVTAQKPTSISATTTGNFITSKDVNLIIGKVNRVEIFIINKEGLKPFYEFSVYGTITHLELFKLQGEEKDLLLILTEKLKLSILSYNLANNEIENRFSADLTEQIGHRAELGSQISIDMQARAIAFHNYEGSIRILRMNEFGPIPEHFDFTIPLKNVQQMKFIYESKPTIVVLFEETDSKTSIQKFEIDLLSKTASSPVISGELSANMIIPVPAPTGGYIIVSDDLFTYERERNEKISIPNHNNNSFICFAKIDQDGSRHLISDAKGGLYVLILEKKNNQVSNLVIEKIGLVNKPNSMNYLDNGFVFIAAFCADSQLIELLPRKNNDNSFIEEREIFTNIGSILDLVWIDSEKSGLGQVVTCSGSSGGGSLSVVRNGTTINQRGVVDLPGIKSLSAIRISTSSEFENLLVISFMAETKFLSVSDEEFELSELPTFSSDCTTILCQNTINNTIIQITPKTVKLLKMDNLQVVSIWNSPENSLINAASSNGIEILIAISGGNLVLLEIENDTLKQKNICKFDHEIACVNIQYSPNSTLSTNFKKAAICAVGLWTDTSINLLNVPNLTNINKQFVGDVIPRSILLCELQSNLYLLCGLGDGHLITFNCDKTTFELTNYKKIALGTQALSLTPFITQSNVNVFSCSDRPALIFSKNERLLFCSVDMKQISCICSLNSKSYTNSLTISDNSTLTIGTIESLGQLHLLKIPIGQGPRRICIIEQANAVVVIATKEEAADSLEQKLCYVHAFDLQNFEKRDSFELNQDEDVSSICSCIFSINEDLLTEEFCIVGTAYLIPDEEEPTKGRILLFSFKRDKIHLVAQLETNGAVYSIKRIRNKVAVAINNTIQIINYTSDNQLVSECSIDDGILTWSIATYGDYIIAADLMHSIGLFNYKSNENHNSISLLARDFNPIWMIATEVIDEDTYIGADNSGNIFYVVKNSDANSDEERKKLITKGKFHLGESINCFKRGSLAFRNPDKQTSQIKSILFGTVNGTVGVIAPLSQEQFKFFQVLQDEITQLIPGIGNFVYSDWRTFQNENTIEKPSGFIDGDIVESFIDLKEKDKQILANKLNKTVNEITNFIENFARTLH